MDMQIKTDKALIEANGNDGDYMLCISNIATGDYVAVNDIETLRAINETTTILIERINNERQ